MYILVNILKTTGLIFLKVEFYGIYIISQKKETLYQMTYKYDLRNHLTSDQVRSQEFHFIFSYLYVTGFSFYGRGIRFPLKTYLH